MPLDRGRATDASLQTEARKKPVPPIEITEAYGPPIIWYDRLINLSMRCSTWRGNDLTKLSRQAQLLGLSEIRTADTLPVHDIIHRQRQFFSSHSFPVPATGLNPSPSSAPAHCGV